MNAESFPSFTAAAAAPVASGSTERPDAAAPAAPEVPGLVDLIAAATPGLRATARPADAAAPGGGLVALVGVCIDDRHPSLAGRVLVRIADGPGEREIWLATLARLPVRREDRVLLLQPGNWPEPLVVGVIDGLRERTAATSAAAALSLKNDETLEVRDQDGTPLLAIVPTPAGPVLRLARADQRLEIAGKLAVAADAIAFEARGEVSLAAGGDVVVTGEEIKLN